MAGVENLTPKSPQTAYLFGDFTLDLLTGCLLHHEVEIKLRPKSFDVLTYLVRNSGRLIPKEELIGAVWPDTFVTDDSLVKCLRDVRVALHDEAQTLVKTVPRRGYVFAFEVTEQPKAPAPTPEAADFALPSVDQSDDGSKQSGEARAMGLEPEVAEQKPDLTRGTRLVTMALIVLGLLVLASAIPIVYRRSHTPPQNRSDPAAPVTSIAVLPFKNLCHDPGDDALVDGMTESLISALSKVQGLRVISRSSVFSFKGKEVDPREVGKTLGVETLLEGSVMKSGDTLRVGVQLVSTADGRVLWASDPQDRPLSECFSLQDDVVRQVVSGLRMTLGRESEQRMAKRYTENLEAYQAYLKGQFFLNKRNGDGLSIAITSFQQAIDIDPNYALAYAGLADSYILKRIYLLLERNETPQQMEEKAKTAAEKALELDDTLAEAHTSLGMIKSATEADGADIERTYQRAIELNPNYATAHHWYALHLNDRLRFDEAIAEIRRAQDLDPRSLVINSDIGIILSSARRYDQAIDQFKKAIELDPNFPDAHAMLGWTYVRKKMYSEGIAEFEIARKLFGSPISQLDAIIYAYGLSGKRNEALQVLAELGRLTKQNHAQLPWESWLFIHIGLGEHDKAFALLEKAHRERRGIKRALDMPYVDPLRSDPRFAELRRRVGSTVGNQN